MIRTLTAAYALAGAFVALPQTPSGGIAGTVRNSDGAVLGATVQVTNAATRVVYTTMTDADGFALAALPAGTYEIVVQMRTRLSRMTRIGRTR